MDATGERSEIFSFSQAGCVGEGDSSQTIRPMRKLGHEGAESGPDGSLCPAAADLAEQGEPDDLQQGQGEQQDHEVEQGVEARRVRSRASPEGPTVDEIRTHRITHLPFRSWCRHCVAARGRNFPHCRSAQPSRGEYPILHLDYCFPRNEVGGDSVGVLVGRFSDSQALISHVVPMKGAGVEWTVKQVVRDIEKMGIFGTIILRSDQEPALIDLCKSVAKERGEARTLLENSAVGESQANGKAEKAVQVIEEMARTVKLDLEEKMQGTLPVTASAFAWLIEHVADVQNKCHVRLDGTTSYEQVKKKRHNGEMFEFGCQIMHRIPGKPQGSLMTARWLPGTWLGKRFNSEEHIVATENGKVVKARAVRLVEPHEQWCVEKVIGVKGVPWDPSGDKKDEVQVEWMKLPDLVPDPGRRREEGLPRSTPITQRHLDKVGYTAQGCAKCRAMMNGDEEQPRGHSANCRERVYKALREDNEMKTDMERADERKEQFKRRREEEKHDVPEQVEAERSFHGGEHQHQAGLEQGQSEQAAQVRAQDVRVAAQQPVPADMEDDLEDAPAQQGDVQVQTSGQSSGSKRPRNPAEDEEETERARLFRQIEPEDDDAFADMNTGWNQDGHLENLYNIMEETERSIKNMKDQDGCAYDSAEIFSPSRTSARANERGLRGGFSLDLKFVDKVTGRKWNLADSVDQDKCRKLIARTKPRLLTVSPPCTLFGLIQNLPGGAKNMEAMKEAISLVNFAVEMCLLQHKGNRLFVFEHPAGATSWKLTSLSELRSAAGVLETVSHMFREECDAWTSTPSSGTSISSSRTSTPSSGVRSAKSKRRSDESGALDGSNPFSGGVPTPCFDCCRIHFAGSGSASDKRNDIASPDVVLSSLHTGAASSFAGEEREYGQGRGSIKKPTRVLTNSQAVHGLVSRKAAEYPRDLCDAFLDGMLMEKDAAKSSSSLNLLQCTDMCDEKEDENITRMTMWATDDVSGEALDPVLVQKARSEEMQGFKEFGVYDHVRREDAFQDKFGKKIGVRWVDVNNGRKAHPKIHSRLVGQEFAGGEAHDDLFAATPPLAATMALISFAASQGATGASAKRIMIVDVKKAFLYGKINRSVYIELPQEDPMSSSGLYVGKLVKAMYGTRDAPMVWQGEVRRTMT